MQVLNKAKDKANAMATTAAQAATAVANAVMPEALPPPRDKWTYGLFASCGKDFSLGFYACVCPLCTTPELRAYRKTGNLDAKPDSLMAEAMCFFFMGDGFLSNERTQMYRPSNWIDPGLRTR